MSITIAIPFYNAEAYLADSIRSVFAQTHQDWELILIDDGSSDGSLKIAQAVKDPRVRVIADGKNKKLAGRLNEITELATYDYIARMDADDLMSPSRLEKQLKVLEADPDLDLVSTGNFSMSNDDELVGVRWNAKNTVTLTELLNRSGSVVHASILARKKWYQLNKYDTNLKTAQDLELWIRASAEHNFNIYILQEPLYYYREEGNLSIDKLLRAFKVERKLLKTYIGNYSPLILKSYLKTIVAKGLDLFSLQKILLKGRNNPIEEGLLLVAMAELEVIKNTKVPGIDS